MKFCSICKKTREEDYFSKNRARPDGLNTRCKSCDLDRMREIRRNIPKMVWKPKVCINLIRGLRYCQECETFKPFSDFIPRVNKGGGISYGNLCEICKKVRAVPTIEEYNKNRKLRVRFRILLKRYKLTPELYFEKLARQNNSCAICKTTVPGGTGSWHVDHDHACCLGEITCGKCVRGLLCFICNQGLGSFKDKPASLRTAAEYLESYRDKGMATHG